MQTITDSSNIQGADWDNGILIIEFKGGTQYRYFDVPDGVYQELMSAASKGKFVNENIKGRFEFEKL
jgi:hypothetical protein